MQYLGAGACFKVEVVVWRRVIDAIRDLFLSAHCETEFESQKLHPGCEMRCVSANHLVFLHAKSLASHLQPTPVMVDS